MIRSRLATFSRLSYTSTPLRSSQNASRPSSTVLRRPTTSALTTPSFCVTKSLQFHTSSPRKDIFILAFPALKAGLLDISRITLLALPFVYRYRLWKKYPRTSLALLQIPIWAVCIVIALAADQAPNTGRWRLLMMSKSEEIEWARHRLNECLAAEGSFILPPDDPRVEQVKRVSERIIAAIEEDQNQPSHIVSAAQWPSTLSASLYEETLRTFDHDPHRVRGPSAIATSALLPHRLESSNPNKIFGDQDWKIYVVDLPRINAFALPTKEIFVYTGIIDLLEDDSMLSGVLAHEIAHVQQRHAVENAGFLNLATILFDCLRGVSYAFTISFPLVTDASASVLNFLHDYVAESAYSRKLEMEADSVGLGFMAKAGYHPQSMLDLWEVMAEVEEDAALSGQPISITDRFPFLKTHPTSVQRQKNISTKIPEAIKLYESSPFRRTPPKTTVSVATPETT
ncbi:hypothetical protein FRC03_001042 [Tulasnella sp. 419]|nr:hypothetical protein FRC03_001042 [Tulasnella sp. 419]